MVSFHCSLAFGDLLLELLAHTTLNHLEVLEVVLVLLELCYGASLRCIFVFLGLTHLIK